MDSTFWFFVGGLFYGTFLGYQIGYGKACRYAAKQLKAEQPK